MLALQIQDIKSFMSRLLLQDTFDTFLLKEAQITTSVTHTIDGRIHKDFFDEPDLSDDCIAWKEMKGFCFSVIKGKRVPLNFRFIFRLNTANTKKLLESSGIDLVPEQVSGLFLNCHFDGKQLVCTSGTSLAFFTLDKTLDHVWDELLLKFFRKNGIPATKL